MPVLPPTAASTMASSVVGTVDHADAAHPGGGHEAGQVGDGAATERRRRRRSGSGRSAPTPPSRTPRRRGTCPPRRRAPRRGGRRGPRPRDHRGPPRRPRRGPADARRVRCGAEAATRRGESVAHPSADEHRIGLLGATSIAHRVGEPGALPFLAHGRTHETPRRPRRTRKGQGAGGTSGCGSGTPATGVGTLRGSSVPVEARGAGAGSPHAACTTAVGAVAGGPVRPRPSTAPATWFAVRRDVSTSTVATSRYRGARASSRALKVARGFTPAEQRAARWTCRCGGRRRRGRPTAARPGARAAASTSAGGEHRPPAERQHALGRRRAAPATTARSRARNTSSPSSVNIVRDRLARPFDDQRVDVGERRPEAAGQHTADRRLAGTGRADQDQSGPTLRRTFFGTHDGPG